MKPHAGVREEATQRSVAPVGTPEVGCVSAVGLSGDERRVIECLREAGTGLTAKQLQSRVKDAPGELDTTLAGLVERQLVARLNTLIPSYSYRDPDSKAHSE